MRKYGLYGETLKSFNENISVNELARFIENIRLYQRDNDAGLIIENGLVTGIELTA